MAELVAAAGGGDVALSDDEVERLTLFAVSARYPGHVDATPQEAAEAVENARKVLDWVVRAIGEEN
ncbi:MAG: HEPN domain-containing protein [Armatimonadetes bacterium]|nr:HEPN domain-containing protein [Armatimonadota bacterium]